MPRKGTVKALTYAAYTRRRLRNPLDIIAQIEGILKPYMRRNGLDRATALRDIVTESQNLAELHGLDFEEIIIEACQSFTEERHDHVLIGGTL